MEVNRQNHVDVFRQVIQAWKSQLQTTDEMLVQYDVEVSVLSESDSLGTNA